MKRAITNLFICTFLSLIFIDAIPVIIPGHQQLKDRLDPFLDASGLWQETWILFSPDTKKRSSRFSVEVVARDGSNTNWSSPSFPELSICERFLQFREGQFYDSVRNDEFSGAWPSIAEYFKREFHPHGLINTGDVSIELTRHWWDVPPPESDLPKPKERAYIFYKETAGE
ncbi:MAG: hypothetical protein ACSHYA_08865 [Opitutaceae bacterium]